MKKMNNSIKKIAVITSASLLAACAMVPALNANAQKVNITLGEGVYNGEEVTRAYTYTQILSGTSETKENGEIELKNPVWNTDNINVAGLLTALKGDATFSVEGVNPFKDGMSAPEFADVVQGFGYDSAKSQALANAIVANIKGGETAYNSETGIGADGYYVIKDASPVAGVYNSIGRYILTTIDEDSSTPIAATLKASAPSVIKKVQEDDNSVKSITNGTTLEDAVVTAEKWNDVADYCIGEAVPFQLYGSMPSTLGDYKGYFYRFNDTLGSQFNQPEKVTVTVEGTELEFNKQTDGSYTGTDKNCRVTFADGKLTVSFENIKAYEGVDVDTIVTVNYSAVLNNEANIGIPGQVNKVDLNYSNNPTVEYNPNTDDETENTDDKIGKTPEDKVVVFTYEADVSKYNTAGIALEGAKFVLTRGTGNDTEYVKIDNNNKVEGWTKNQAEASTLTSTAEVASIKVIGLDDGTYTLIETEAPKGYKLPDGDAAKFEFTIDATTDNSQTWDGSGETPETVGSSVLTKIDVTVDAENALLTIDEKNENLERTVDPETQLQTLTWKVENGAVGVAITNTSGTTLPGTGGIGTTIFYLGGGLMTAVGGIYLISKRRTKENE